MGYDQAQTLKALREAESYPGPAIVICYCPCLEQHIKAGMSCTQDEMKKAVECGYWHLYRYDPRRIAEGKNPFQLDSPAPDTDKLMDFLMGENRFASLKNNFPERADALYQKEIADVKAGTRSTARWRRTDFRRNRSTQDAPAPVTAPGKFCAGGIPPAALVVSGGEMHITWKRGRRKEISAIASPPCAPAGK